MPFGDLPASLGNYEVLGRLARGGMAEVLLARATGAGGFERLFVIKRLLPAMAANDATVRMFLDEARICARLRHPNIVQVLAIGQASEGAYLVMELLHGRDLTAVLRRVASQGERLPLPIVVHVAQAICAGLHHAHACADAAGRPLGIVHRDISPHNVFVTYEGEVKVIDFGIAKAEGRLGDTRTGVIKGKYGYMSPEQIRGDALDRRSDIYSAGVVLYELSTARKLFCGENPFELMRATIDGDVPRPGALVAGYPPALEAIVLRALATERDGRYPTALAMHDDLEAFRRDAQLATTAVELGRWMRARFAAEVDAWDSAGGDPAQQLAMLRAQPSDPPLPAASDPEIVIEEVSQPTRTLAPGRPPRRGRIVAAVVGVGLAGGLVAIAAPWSGGADAPAALAPVALEPSEPPPAPIDAAIVATAPVIDAAPATPDAPAIELAPRRRRPRREPAATAAPVTVDPPAIAAAPPAESPPPPPPPAVEPPPAVDPPPAELPARRLARLRGQRRDVERKRDAAPDPAARAALDQRLQELDAEIAATRRALSNDPR